MSADRKETKTSLDDHTISFSSFSKHEIEQFIEDPENAPEEFVDILSEPIRRLYRQVEEIKDSDDNTDQQDMYCAGERPRKQLMRLLKELFIMHLSHKQFMLRRSERMRILNHEKMIEIWNNLDARRQRNYIRHLYAFIVLKRRCYVTFQKITPTTCKHLVGSDIDMNDDGTFAENIFHRAPNAHIVTNHLERGRKSGYKIYRYTAYVSKMRVTQNENFDGNSSEQLDPVSNPEAFAEKYILWEQMDYIVYNNEKETGEAEAEVSQSSLFDKSYYTNNEVTELVHNTMLDNFGNCYLHGMFQTCEHSFAASRSMNGGGCYIYGLKHGLHETTEEMNERTLRKYVLGSIHGHASFQQWSAFPDHYVVDSFRYGSPYGFFKKIDKGLLVSIGYVFPSINDMHEVFEKSSGRLTTAQMVNTFSLKRSMIAIHDDDDDDRECLTTLTVYHPLTQTCYVQKYKEALMFEIQKQRSTSKLLDPKSVCLLQQYTLDDESKLHGNLKTWCPETKQLLICLRYQNGNHDVSDDPSLIQTSIDRCARQHCVRIDDVHTNEPCVISGRCIPANEFYVSCRHGHTCGIAKWQQLRNWKNSKWSDINADWNAILLNVEKRRQIEIEDLMMNYSEFESGSRSSSSSRNDCQDPDVMGDSHEDEDCRESFKYHSDDDAAVVVFLKPNGRDDQCFQCHAPMLPKIFRQVSNPYFSQSSSLDSQSSYPHSSVNYIF